jgi:hypothetical protein
MVMLMLNMCRTKKYRGTGEGLVKGKQMRKQESLESFEWSVSFLSFGFYEWASLERLRFWKYCGEINRLNYGTYVVSRLSTSVHQVENARIL